MGTPEVQAKLVLLGDSGVGKSSLALRFIKNQFVENSEPTIGAAFFTQIVSLPEKTVKFEIWDTAGQERFRALAPMYYRDAAAAIVVYDTTNAESLNGAKSWVRELQRQGHPNVVVALAGNKTDLTTKRQVATEDAKAYATEVGMLFYETSAKTAVNINELFREIARKIPARATTSSAQIPGSGISSAPAKESSGCC